MGRKIDAYPKEEDILFLNHQVDRRCIMNSKLDPNYSG